MKPIQYTITLLVMIAFISCDAQPANSPQNQTEVTKTNKMSNDSTHGLSDLSDIAPIPEPMDFEFPENREKILENLRQKIDSGEFLTVHVFVPLCDNEHQGIVPTSPSIGNGMDAKRNLYWGTSKGMKRFFKELPDWKMIHTQTKPVDNVLDRAVFTKKYNSGVKVRLIMDAYRGDRMKVCLEDYFKALAGITMDSINTENGKIPAYGNSDLIIFNGHNGLMDEDPKSFDNVDSRPKDAVAIACISQRYFKPYWEKSGSYPLVMTTGLMYPGAFCTEFIINEWALLKDAETCRTAAGKGYYKYKPKSGPNGSNNLFSTGW